MIWVGGRSEAPLPPSTQIYRNYLVMKQPAIRKEGRGKAAKPFPLPTFLAGWMFHKIIPM